MGSPKTAEKARLPLQVSVKDQDRTYRLGRVPGPDGKTMGQSQEALVRRIYQAGLAALENGTDGSVSTPPAGKYLSDRDLMEMAGQTRDSDLTALRSEVQNLRFEVISVRKTLRDALVPMLELAKAVTGQELILAEKLPSEDV